MCTNACTFILLLILFYLSPRMIILCRVTKKPYNAVVLCLQFSITCAFCIVPFVSWIVCFFFSEKLFHFSLKWAAWQVNLDPHGPRLCCSLHLPATARWISSLQDWPRDTALNVLFLHLQPSCLSANMYQPLPMLTLLAAVLPSRDDHGG